MTPGTPAHGVVALAAVLVAAAAVPSAGAGGVAADASFEETVVSVDEGGVVNVTVTTDAAATVNLGGPDQGFWFQVGVESGTTRLRVNTYRAGRAGRYTLSEMVWAAEGSITARRLRTEPLDSMLEPAEYPMNVTIDGTEQALGSLVVDQRATNGVSVRVAPQATDVAALGSTAEVEAATVVPDNGSVARGDWLVVHVDATGLDGSVRKGFLDGDGPGVRIEFTERAEMNAEPEQFTGASAERLVFPRDGEGFYLFVDTADHGIEPGERYDLGVVVPADSDLADDRESVSTTFTVVERRVRLRYAGDELTVEDATTVAGTTTLAPGTTVNLTARDTDIPPIHRQRTVTVGEDYRFAAEFDFSDLEPGREFEIRLADQGRAVPAVVAGGTTTTAGTTTATTTGSTTASTQTATATRPGNGTTTTAASDATTTTADTATTAATTTADGLTQAAVQATERPLTQRALRDELTTENSGGAIPGFDAFGGVAALLAALLAAGRASR